MPFTPLTAWGVDMSVYACLKQVPNLEGIPSDNPEAGFVKADAWYLNPLDAYALRGALETAALLQTDCVAVSFGGPEAKDALRQALGLGADRAIHAVANTPLPGPGQIAWALAGAIRADNSTKGHNPHIVFCGRQSSDLANMQVPYRLAACLGFAVVNEVSSWQVQGDSVAVLRQAGSIREYLEADMPCVLALNRGQGEMPHPTLPGLLKAKKKTVQTMSLADIAAAHPAQWASPPEDPMIERAYTVSDERHCHFVEGESVEDRVRELVRLLRNNGSLPQ